MKKSKPALNDTNYSFILEEIDFRKAELQYDFLKYIKNSFVENTTTYLYSGNLHLTSISSNAADKKSLYNFIVDGDLILDDDLNWHTEVDCRFIFVTGDLKSRNIFISGQSILHINGNVEIKNSLMGYNGSEVGIFSTLGIIKAKYVISLLCFMIRFNTLPEAIIIGDPFYTKCRVDFDELDELEDALLPEILDEGFEVNIEALKYALQEGKPYIRQRFPLVKLEKTTLMYF